jgi:hypothetical protein
VLLAVSARGEDAGGLHHQLHAHRLPGELGRVALTEHFDGLAVDDDGPLGGLDCALVEPVGGVPAEERRQDVGRL